MDTAVGMLWFDNSSDPLQLKINRGVEYYNRKYGKQPTDCWINPHMLDGEKELAGLALHPTKSVLPHHFLIGVGHDSR